MPCKTNVRLTSAVTTKSGWDAWLVLPSKLAGLLWNRHSRTLLQLPPKTLSHLLCCLLLPLLVLTTLPVPHLNLTTLLPLTSPTTFPPLPTYLPYTTLSIVTVSHGVFLSNRGTQPASASIGTKRPLAWCMLAVTRNTLFLMTVLLKLRHISKLKDGPRTFRHVLQTPSSHRLGSALLYVRQAR